MSAATTVLVALAAGTYLLKAAGPLALGGRPLPLAVGALAERIPAALLASLVVVSSIADGRELVADARIPGVLAAAVALRLRAPFVVVVLVAVATTAGVRALPGLS